MKGIFTIFLLFISHLCISQGLNGLSWEEELDSLNREGLYDESGKLLHERLLQQDTSLYFVHSDLAYTYIMRDMYDSAWKHIDASIALNDSCAYCYFLSAIIYFWHTDDYERSNEAINKSIALNSDRASYYSFRARVRGHLSYDRVDILSDYEKAIELQPDNDIYYLRRGFFNMNNDFYALSIRDFTKAIELNPDNWEGYFYRAEGYVHYDMFDEALEDINKAILLDSSQFKLYNARGIIHKRLREFEDALEDYNRALAMGGDEVIIYYNRKKLYYRMEDMDASCADLQRAISKGKKTRPKGCPDVQRALKEYNHLCDSNGLAYYYHRGIASYNLGKFEKAIDYYEAGMEKFPHNGYLYSVMGNAYFTMEAYEKALKAYEHSLENKESFLLSLENHNKQRGYGGMEVMQFFKFSVADVYLKMGWCLLHQGKLEEALAKMNEGKQLVPEGVVVVDHLFYGGLGAVYLAKEQHDRAIAKFDKGIEIAPDFPDYYLQRATAKMMQTHNVRVTSFFFRGEPHDHNPGIRWAASRESPERRQRESLESAMEDAMKALEIDADLAQAHYIIGLIRRLMNQPGYCVDILTAHQMGFPVDEKLMGECVNR